MLSPVGIRCLIFAVLTFTHAAAQESSGSQPRYDIVTLLPQQCKRIKVGSDIPERAAYQVEALVVGLSGGCNARQVLQSLPQDPKHFGTAEYDNSTSCDDVKNPTLQGRFSTKEKLSLEFFPVVNPLTQSVPYTVCSDTTWKSATFGTELVGPFDTWVFLDNACATGNVTLSLTVSRNNNVSAEEYCDELVDQVSGTRTVEIISIVAGAMGLIVISLGCCLCTACCSCWCCCARSGRCATACSRSCHSNCVGCVTAIGCGWIMGRVGGLTFYNTSQSSPLLFWAFSAACLTTFQVVNLPEFDRDDTLNPDHKDAQTSWGTEEVRDIPVVRFMTSLLASFLYSVIAFGSVPLVFSDPLRDKSFRSKAAVAGVLLLATNIVAVCMLLDFYRYFDLWPYKAPQVALQCGLFLSHVMATFSFFKSVYHSHAQRRAHRAKLPQATPGRPGAPPATVHAAELHNAASLPPAPLPYAGVAAPPPGTPGSTRCAGPVGEGAEQHGNEDSTQHATDDATWASSGAPGLTLSMPPAVRPSSVPIAHSADQTHPFVRDQNEVSGRHGSQAALGEGLEPKLSLKDADTAVTQSDEGFDEFTSTVPSTADELEEAWRGDEAGRNAFGVAAVEQFLRKAWDSVKEEQRIGFRYSVFMSASLFITAITTTSSFLRAVSTVVDLAKCTKEDSDCLYEVQRWVYERLLRSFVKVNIDVLELQANGICESVATGNTAGLSGSQVSTDLSTPEVLAACNSASQLAVAQEADLSHPKWLADAETPVLVGGFAAVIIAYCISMYTIYHVAKAYKRLELKLRAARLAALLWKRGPSQTLAASQSCSTSDTASTAAISDIEGVPSRNRGASTGSATTKKARAQLGKDILQDYETVSIGQSAYFTGTLVSTCFIQLWLGASILGAVFVTLLHPAFWVFVGDNIGWPISFAIILCWHILSQLFLNRYVTDGKRIKRPFMWLFLYIALSAGYCVVAVLLAAMRLIQLVLTSILALSRLDSCLFTVLRGRDRGYASFLAMALMLHSFQQCLKETASGNDDASPATASRSIVGAGGNQGRTALQRRWQAAASMAVAGEAAGSSGGSGHNGGQNGGTTARS